MGRQSAPLTNLWGIKIGQWAMIGAGSVVTHDVPSYGLAYGNPAGLHEYVFVHVEQL
jgi:UDP-2-acetamido-3-amino-2,3-dideoxy-glucuronate N-acetyltransferase